MDDLRDRLGQAIPLPRSELRHEDAWQLLIATMLSAQSTDRTVNRVTLSLFDRWPSAEALAAAPQDEVEEVVRPTGFFRNKAKAIREASRILVERHGGEVPRSMDELVALPGVARKTANVVLGTAWGVTEGIVVDTHAARVARRLGLTDQGDPKKIERDLCDRFPREAWNAIGHRLVLHGRYVCVARNPRCARCPLNEICPSSEAAAEGSVAERAEQERRVVEAALEEAWAPLHPFR